MQQHTDLSFCKSDDGAAAIEFAFISAFLAFVLMSVIDLGLLVFQRSNMTSAMKAGIDYFMVGGNELNEAESIVKATWVSMPENSTVSASFFCTCQNVNWVCTENCSDESLPISYSKITVETYYEGLLINRTHKVDEEIRIR